MNYFNTDYFELFNVRPAARYHEKVTTCGWLIWQWQPPERKFDARELPGQE